jgi:hypothetical protein
MTQPHLLLKLERARTQALHPRLTQAVATASCSGSHAIVLTLAATSTELTVSTILLGASPYHTGVGSCADANTAAADAQVGMCMRNWDAAAPPAHKAAPYNVMLSAATRMHLPLQPPALN